LGPPGLSGVYAYPGHPFLPWKINRDTLQQFAAGERNEIFHSRFGASSNRKNGLFWKTALGNVPFPGKRSFGMA